MFAPVAIEDISLPQQSLREFSTFEGQQWNRAMSQLNTTAFAYQTSSVRVGASLAGATYKYIGSALASNGKIYASGHNQNRTLMIDTINITRSELTGATNQTATGMMFDKITNFCYAFGTNGIKVDCSTDTPSNITAGAARSGPPMQSPDGNRIFNAATCCKTAGVYDYIVSTNTAALISTVSLYRAGVAMSSVNNCMYWGNDTATNYLKWDPATSTVTTFTGSIALTAYTYPSMVNYFDGFLYSFGVGGTNGDKIRRIDPVTLQVTDVFTQTVTYTQLGSQCIGGDGRIYSCFGGGTPQSGQVRYYDPRDNTEGLLCTISNSDTSFSSIRMGVDGSLYVIPRDGAYVHRIAPARGSEYVTNIVKEYNFGGRYGWV